MLSDKVQTICEGYGYKRCPECPLFSVCSTDNDGPPGDTQAEKTKVWEQAMNNAAEKV